jgi:hypothetical protein
MITSKRPERQNLARLSISYQTWSNLNNLQSLRPRTLQQYNRDHSRLDSQYHLIQLKHKIEYKQPFALLNMLLSQPPHDLLLFFRTKGLHFSIEKIQLHSERKQQNSRQGLPRFFSSSRRSSVIDPRIKSQ